MSQQLSASRIYNTIALKKIPLDKVVCHFVYLWIGGAVCGNCLRDETKHMCNCVLVHDSMLYHNRHVVVTFYIYVIWSKLSGVL